MPRLPRKQCTAVLRTKCWVARPVGEKCSRTLRRFAAQRPGSALPAAECRAVILYNKRELHRLANALRSQPHRLVHLPAAAAEARANDRHLHGAHLRCASGLDECDDGPTLQSRAERTCPGGPSGAVLPVSDTGPYFAAAFLMSSATPSPRGSHARQS